MAEKSWHRGPRGLEVRLETEGSGVRWSAWRRMGGRPPVLELQHLPPPPEEARTFASVEEAIEKLSAIAEELTRAPDHEHSPADGPKHFGCC